jgi:hypothetical protein
MPQAIHDPKPLSLTFGEIQNLADRLLARGSTRLGSEPEQQRDLRLAAKVIRNLMRSFNRGDVVTLENGT